MSATTTNTAAKPMEYVRLGNTGVKVSKICLGCMSFGSSQWQKWVLDEEESLQVIQRAVELGINFFDTADAYSNGESERVLGRAIKKLGLPRDEIVVATKVFFAVGKNVNDDNFTGLPDVINGRGLSRKHIFEAVEASLERLQLSYIDLYQIHRWDYNTPIEETMEALHDLVKAGKVRYIGASSMYAWQFAKANYIAKQRGWTQFISMQDLYNLIYREEEREMIPLCKDLGVSLIPWSPLARGVLTDAVGSRATTDFFRKLLFENIPEHNKKADEEVVKRAQEVAKKLDISTAQVAVAWLLSKPQVASPIVGVSKVKYLEDIVKAIKVKLSPEDIKYLEESYVHKAIQGFS